MTVKKTVFLLFVVIIALVLTGCSSNTVSGDVMESVSNGKSMIMFDDSLAQHCWAPKDRKAVSAKVVGWLKKVKPYKGTIPKVITLGDVTVNANIWPSTLHISNYVTISPACYPSTENQNYQINFIENIIEIDKSGEKSYWQSKELYDWLKNDRWKPEFEKAFT